jgi:biopolymer transport protein ExbD
VTAVRRRHDLDTSEGPGINMTPLLDMVFIILIFFIVTSSFDKESGVEVNRPGAETAQRLEQGNIVIAITEDGQVWMDDQPLDIRSLRRAVARRRAESPEASAVILADAGSRTGLVVQAMDQARLAGVQNVALGAASPR